MFWQGQFFGVPYAVWDNQPGGTIVDRQTYEGVEYLVVEFKNSPGKRYIYRAKEDES